MKTIEKAPRKVGSTRIAASSTETSGCAASSSVIRSESEVAAGCEPRLRSVPCNWWASSAVLTRFPLWPSAMPVPVRVVRKVGWEFSQVEAPVVE